MTVCYNSTSRQESCAIAKMTAQCTLYKCIGSPVEQIRPFKIIQDGGRHLGFDVTRNSADPENPTLEPNMKCIGSPAAEIWPFAYLGVIWNPHFRGRGGRRGSAMAPFEKATVVSYRLSVVIIALSITIRPQFVIECLRRSNQQGVGHFGPKFRVFPLE